MTNADLKVAIVVNPMLTPGLMANTIAAIGIGIGAAVPQLAGDVLTDMNHRAYQISSNRAVPILQAEHRLIRELFLKSLPTPTDAAAVPFPAFARAIHSYAEYAAQIPSRDLALEQIDGIGFAGPNLWVRRLTGSLKLLR